MKPVIFIFFFLMLSCNHHDNQVCIAKTFPRAYVETLTTNDSVSYYHFLVVENYTNACYSQIDFVGIAKRYVDTCSYKLPVRILTFLRESDHLGFESNEPDYAAINRQAIIKVELEGKEIRKIYCFQNGEEMAINIDCK